jgi:hypothetical protein
MSHSILNDIDVDLDAVPLLSRITLITFAHHLRRFRLVGFMAVCSVEEIALKY